MRQLKGVLYLATAAPCALFASGVLAQTTPASSATEPASQAATTIEDIVVTAQKREQAVNTIPLAITAVSSQQLENRGIETVADLQKVAPGFSFADTGVNAPVYSLRGVGYFDYSLAAAPAVSVYLDEVALPYPAMTQGAMIDLQRVEVLRGPQGTLFGQNATGGLVNYIPASPTEDPAAGFKVSYGRFNRTELEGYVSGPLSETLRGRLAVQSVQSDDWQYSYTRDDSTGGANRTSARALLDWDPAANLSVTFNLNGYVDRSAPQATQLIAITPLTPARVRPEVANYPLAPHNARAADWSDSHDPFRDDRFWQASAKAVWDINDSLTLTSITAYSSLDTDDYIDRDGMSNDNSQYGLDGRIEAFSQELRLSGDAQRLNWVLGASYSSADTEENSTVNIESSSNVQNSFGVKFSDASSRVNNKIRSSAIFASGDWNLTDSLTLTTGLRYTKAELDFVGCTNVTEPAAIQAFANISAFFRNANGLPPAAFIPVDGCVVLGTDFLATEPRKTLDEDNVSWRVALNWEVADHVRLFASTSRGYKAGNSITVAGSFDTQYNPVRQEELTAYETGVKATLFDRTMQLNASIFYYDYIDKQARSKIVDPVFGPLQALVNIPSANAKGGEIELQWLPMAGLTVNGGLAYLDTEIEEFIGFDALGAQRDFAGKPFSFAPKLQTNLDVDYSWPLSNGMEAFVGGSVAYRSDATADFDSDPLFDIDAYTLVDARLGVTSADGRWRFSVWGRNLTDEYYWHSVIRVQDSVVRVAGQPRTYGISLGVEF
ncbi:TonB-dependent receptor [Brevundimonas sp.]|nr:TonB-dependent receptor [Brevundimonas sp.]MBD3837581.1 TonB-dependent receptor [Brevundimonas sp.]